MKRWRETWWVFLPLFPLALLGWGAFVYAGARARKRSWIVWGVVYFALTAFGWLAAQGEEDSTVDDLAGPVILLVWVATIVHAFVIRPAYLDRMQLESKLDRAEDRADEREEARRLAEDDPVRALELGVGRPDLDGFAGGLVDLNNAPAAAIEELPGVNRALAERIVRTRAELGGFSSLEDLGHVLELPVALVDRIRADVVVLPRGTEA